MKILVTGSTGQLGSELGALHKQSAHEFVFVDRRSFDLSKPDELSSVLDEHRPELIINCAAYTAVDKAETEQEMAWTINAEAPQRMANWCAQSGAGMIHISTDYVFSGQDSVPVPVDHPVAPINYYGASKLGGDLAVMKALPNAIIIRTSWVYSTFGKNFVKTMIRLMGEKESINVVNDQTGSPTYASDLAAAILEMVRQGLHTGGYFHFSNAGIITWFDFATAIRNEIQSHCIVNGIDSASYPTPAKRPRFSVMNSSRIQDVYGIQLKDWKESLRKCLNLLEKENIS